MFWFVLVTLKRHAWTRDHVEEVRRTIEEYYEYAVLTGLAYTGATILASFSLTVAVCAKVRKHSQLVRKTNKTLARCAA